MAFIAGKGRELQSLVNSAANVSILLWGQGGKLPEQHRPLRESIRVDDSSPLKPTEMRNHYEHIDERLERWWRESEAHNHADRIVGPPDAIEGLKEIELFRSYDPYTTTVKFWGDTYNVKEITDETKRILPLLEVEAGKHHVDK